MIGKIAASFAVGILFTSGALAQGKSESAPGHDRVCLVTTSGGAAGTVLDTKWLPRRAADAQADNQTKFVGTHASVLTQQGCESFPTG